MTKIKLGNIGKVDVGKKLKASLKVSSGKLFESVPELTEKLSDKGRALISAAVDYGEEPKTGEQEQEITQFFEIVKQVSGSLGVGEDEIDEIDKIDDQKRKQMDSGRVDYDDMETIDRSTGKKEGKIVLYNNNKEGKLIPVIIHEEFTTYLEHDGTAAEQDSEVKGELIIENVSTKDRIWDIDLKLDNIGDTDIEEEKIYINQLAPGDKEERAYTLKAEERKDLEVTEFISTLNDSNTESYSLALNADNEIYCGIVVKNISDETLTSLNVIKLVPNTFDNIKILKSSRGDTKKGDIDEDGDQGVEWNIEELKPGGEELLELKLDVKIEDKDEKVRSGKIIVNYLAPKALSGLSIDKFDAYTNNSFYIGTSEMDEVPNKFECQFTFENRSEFLVRLVNADVYDRENNELKYVDIDTDEIPPLPEGAKWESNVWEYENETEEDPNFKTKVEFFVIADHQIETSGNLEMNDVELAVASIEGELSYDVEQIPSFKESTFNAIMKVINTGGANLNDVTLTENIPNGYEAPEAENVMVSLNGNEIEVGSDVINLSKSSISVELRDLKEQDIGAFKPGDSIEVTYPITSNKPSKEMTYVSDVLYTANTYPAGKALEYIPEQIEIEVVHIRKRLIKGKEITGLVAEGEYEIILYVINTGKFDLENFEVADKIPENFEYTELTMDPTETTSEEGADVLKWVIEKIEPGERFEIKYKLSGEGKPSDAQEFA